MKVSLCDVGRIYIPLSLVCASKGCDAVAVDGTRAIMRERGVE